jgi:hypothetical protein
MDPVSPLDATFTFDGVIATVHVAGGVGVGEGGGVGAGVGDGSGVGGIGAGADAASCEIATET